MNAETSAFEMQTDEQALARKRRIELRAKNQFDGEEPSSKRLRFEDSVFDTEDTTELAKPSIRGIKKQARYEPGVPMSKEELAVWRKEARRVRNRESAAASRRKTRDRINELESEVEVLKQKYTAALQRIAELESDEDHPVVSFSPSMIAQDVLGASSSTAIVSPPSSVASSPEFAATVPPSLSPHESLSLCHEEPIAQMYDQHTISISRPTAV